jgi:hypothetical protein
MSTDGGADAGTSANANQQSGGGGGTGWSGRNAGRGRQQNRINNHRQYQPRFEGREPALAGHIYDFTGERMPDQFLKTTKEIKNYVGWTYTKFTADFVQSVEDLALADPVAPANPDPANQLAVEIWKMELKEHREKIQHYQNFRAGLYNVVMGQCTEALEDRLKLHEDYPAANNDGIALLVIIKRLTYSFEERRKLVDALTDVKENFYSF